MLRIRASLTAAALLAAGALGAGPATAHEDHLHELPANGCYSISDPKGDARLNDASQVPNDPDLDILGLVLRTTPSALQAYVKVADLAGGPMASDGHRFFVDFTFNGHAFAMEASHYKVGSGAVRDALAATGRTAGTTQLVVDGKDVTELTADRGFKASGLKATFDPAADFVLMELPFADIGRYGGRAFTGTLTNVVASSAIDHYALSSIADDTAEGGRWNVGDNACFNVATKLALSVTKYPAQRTVTARLTTATGQALAGKTLTYYVNGRRAAVVRTSSTGTAAVRNIKPGSTVRVEFAAVTGYLGTSAQKKV